MSAATVMAVHAVAMAGAVVMRENQPLKPVFAKCAYCGRSPDVSQTTAQCVACGAALVNEKPHETEETQSKRSGRRTYQPGPDQPRSDQRSHQELFGAVPYWTSNVDPSIGDNGASYYEGAAQPTDCPCSNSTGGCEV